MEGLAAYLLCSPGRLWAPPLDPGQHGHRALLQVDIKDEHMEHIDDRIAACSDMSVSGASASISLQQAGAEL